jgi:hypothetical protein
MSVGIFGASAEMGRGQWENLKQQVHGFAHVAELLCLRLSQEELGSLETMWFNRTVKSRATFFPPGNDRYTSRPCGN